MLQSTTTDHGVVAEPLAEGAETCAVALTWSRRAGAGSARNTATEASSARRMRRTYRDPVRCPRRADFERCIAAGGVAVFPADTVYGLACDPDNAEAVERLYALKGRPTGKPSAVMFFDAELALAALPELGARTRAVMARLLPGGVTLLLPNPRGRYPLAGGEGLGLRVPDVPVLRGARRVVLQSSANVAGAPDARRLEDVPQEIRLAADLVIDAGELPARRRR